MSSSKTKVSKYRRYAWFLDMKRLICLRTFANSFWTLDMKIRFMLSDTYPSTRLYTFYTTNDPTPHSPAPSILPSSGPASPWRGFVQNLHKTLLGQLTFVKDIRNMPSYNWLCSTKQAAHQLLCQPNSPVIQYSILTLESESV